MGFVTTHYSFDIARGWVTGVDRVRKFGHNSDIGVAAYEDVWDGGGVYPWPTTARVVRVAAGGNAADTTDGAGARAICVVGMDSTWTTTQEIIYTAGAAAGAYGTTEFIRVFRAYVCACGTYGGSNVGTVTIESAASTLAIIAPTLGQTRMALFTVPDGKIGYATNIMIEVESLRAISMQLMQRQRADVTTAPVQAARIVSEWGAVAGHINHDYTMYPAKFPARTDVWCRAIQTTVGGTSEVSCEFSMILMDEDLDYDGVLVC